jgi:hypothetical protein
MTGIFMLDIATVIRELLRRKWPVGAEKGERGGRLQDALKGARHWSCARDPVAGPRNASPPSALTFPALFYHHLLMNAIPKLVQGQMFNAREAISGQFVPKIFAFCEMLAYRYLLAYVADEPSPCETA